MVKLGVLLGVVVGRGGAALVALGALLGVLLVLGGHGAHSTHTREMGETRQSSRALGVRPQELSTTAREERSELAGL